jgi:hypothetical protein
MLSKQRPPRNRRYYLPVIPHKGKLCMAHFNNAIQGAHSSRRASPHSHSFECHASLALQRSPIRNGFVKPGTYIRSFSTITRHYFCVVSTTSEQHCRGLWRPAAIRLLFWILAVFGPSSKSARQHIPLSLSDSSLSDPVRVTKKHAAHGAHYHLPKNTPPEQWSLRQYMSTPLRLNLICSFTVSPCFYLVKSSSLTVLSLRTDILRTTEGETHRRDVSPRLLRSTTISILPLISGWSAHHRDRRRRAWSSRTICLRGASVRA